MVLLGITRPPYRLSPPSQCREILGDIGDDAEENEAITKLVSSRPRVTDSGLFCGGLHDE